MNPGSKAPVSRPRKALGRIHGLAVRFGDPVAGTLLVGEGIETVLSIVTAIPETVAAAALSAGSLGAFAPPPGVTRLVIARDNDAEGERAAERLVRRCARTGVAALVVVPEGDDFNSDLVALGAATLHPSPSPPLPLRCRPPRRLPDSRRPHERARGQFGGGVRHAGVGRQERGVRIEATGGEGSRRRGGHRRVWTRGRARCRPRDRNGAPAGDRRCARSRRRRRGTV